MASLTTFRIGGAAALFLEPEDEQDLAAAGDAIVRADIPFVVLGKGSNVLVADAGFPGLVLRLGRGFRWAARDGDVVRAGGAMPLPALVRHRAAARARGSRVRRRDPGEPRRRGADERRGARRADERRGRGCSRCSTSATGHTDVLAAAEVGFGYRHTDLRADAVVIGAHLRLHPGDPTAIRAAMDDARRWRRETQPIAEPNCGSVFTNPPGAHAAALIDAAGLKGERVGGACVSRKHANFIVTEPGATAADVEALIGVIQQRVEAAAGIRLTPEVRVIGGERG